MKSPKHIYALLVLVLCVAEGINAAVIFPVGKPEHEFVYDYARRDEINGGFYYYNYNVAPYNLDEAALDGELFAFADGVNHDNLRTFAFLTEDFRSAKYSRAGAFEYLRGGIVTRPVKNLFLYSNFIVDERMADDPEYTGKKWHGAAGEVEEAFAAYSNRNFDVILGRFASFWGPASQSLILSGEARPMDAFSFRFKWGRIHFTYQFGKLQRLAVSTDSTGYFENRYFAGHRIDFRLFDNFNIGLFETIVFGGRGRHPELSYLNPLLIYHAVQLNEDDDDNTLLGLDITYYLNNRHKLYGQL
ncbi:MAG: hypothetical protein JSU69_01255, partial [Candidatus Zixiibacteriota bacterium]